MGSEVVVLHVDADAFFASVEQRQKPSTALAPVVVCGLGPRGVVATASYEARRFGVGSAMPTATARRRCPQGMFLAPRMQAYREHSAAIMAVLAGFADVLEQVSIDEAYLVVSAHPGSVTEVLAAVVDAVWQGTGLRAAGVGGGRALQVGGEVGVDGGEAPRAAGNHPVPGAGVPRRSAGGCVTGHRAGGGGPPT